MASMGRILIVLGLLLAVIGMVLLLGGRLGLGRLPGDFVLRRGGWTFAFPLATSLLLSLALTLLLNVILRRR
ncbi:MAG: DUF2905 family protein [Armatimonadota bacterium]|nr:DUF2905 family protein [Armatimonadota bacterium]